MIDSAGSLFKALKYAFSVMSPGNHPMPYFSISRTYHSSYPVRIFNFFNTENIFYILIDNKYFYVKQINDCQGVLNAHYAYLGLKYVILVGIS